MSLTHDIEKAFLKSMNDPDDVGNIPELAEDLSKAVVTWLTKQTFTITEMKAILEVEEISTTAPLSGDVLGSVQINPGQAVTTTGGPGQTTSPGFINSGTGKKGILIPKINYKKTGGQGGAMKAVGHSYIGRNPVPGNETNEDRTKVKLLPENVVDE